MSDIDTTSDVPDLSYLIAERMTRYLMGCQVVASDARVALIPDGAGGGAGLLVTRELRGDSEDVSYRLRTPRVDSGGERGVWLSGGATEAEASACWLAGLASLAAAAAPC